MGWEDFLYTGNIESLKQHWPKINQKKYTVDNSSHFLIENVAATALDWPPPYLDGYSYEDGDPGNTFIDNVLNAWNYYAYDHLSKMAANLEAAYPDQGFVSESVNFANIAIAIKENYNKIFYQKNIKRYVDGLNSSHAAMHSSFMPVVFDMVQTDFKNEIADYLITRNMDCGIFGSQFFLWSLYKLNKGEKALELLVSKEKNSWYHVMHELKAANTTEAWDPSGKPDMSKSHAWGSSAGNIIQRGLLGINPLEPGFKKISVKPQTGDLKFAKIDVPTIKGKVSISVSMDSNTYNVEINIPANTSAKVFIRKMQNKGTEVEIDGKVVNGNFDEEDEYIVFDNVGSGLHSFKRTLEN